MVDLPNPNWEFHQASIRQNVASNRVLLLFLQIAWWKIGLFRHIGKNTVSNLPIFVYFCHPIFAHKSTKKAAEAAVLWSCGFHPHLDSLHASGPSRHQGKWGLPDLGHWRHWFALHHGASSNGDCLQSILVGGICGVGEQNCTGASNVSQIPNTKSPFSLIKGMCYNIATVSPLITNALLYRAAVLELGCYS